jgi:hypothetical protein
MAKKIKVRFNLGKGKNYMKWKAEFPTHSEYYSPDEHTLFLFGCQLKNHKKTAEKINQGANKSVCAWILCDQLFLGQNVKLPDGGTQLKYNPRVQPNWMADEAIVDNEAYESIWSDGRKLFGKK